jgi:hypothetical protein
LQHLNLAITEKLGAYAVEKDDSIPDCFDLQAMNKNMENNENITPNFVPIEECVP